MLEINDCVTHSTFNIDGIWVYTKNGKVKIGVYLGEVPHEINIIKYPLEEVVTNLASVLCRKDKKRVANEPIIQKFDTFSRSNVTIGSYFPIYNYHTDKGSGTVTSHLDECLITERRMWELVIFKDSIEALKILETLSSYR
jgi:hypothetical protein